MNNFVFFIFANGFVNNLLFYAIINLDTTCKASDIKLPPNQDCHHTVTKGM